MIHTCSNTDGQLDPSCAACIEQHARDNAGRCAAVFPQPMTWKCERCGSIGYVGNETHRCEEQTPFEELLARSSLGTPDVVAARKSAPRDVVEAVLRRVDADRGKMGS